MDLNGGELRFALLPPDTQDPEAVTIEFNGGYLTYLLLPPPSSDSSDSVDVSMPPLEADPDNPDSGDAEAQVDF